MIKRAEETLFFTSFETDEKILPVSFPLNEISRNMRSFNTETGNGPREVWNNLPNVGWSGQGALKVNGVHCGEGSARAEYSV